MTSTVGEKPPEGTVARLFFNLAWSGDESLTRGLCKKAAERLADGSAKIPLSGNDTRHIIPELAEALGVQYEKEKLGRYVAEAVGRYADAAWPVGGDYAALSILKANFYEHGRVFVRSGFAKYEMRLTGDQTIIALCGAALSYAGIYQHGDAWYYVYAVPTSKEPWKDVLPLAESRAKIPPYASHAVKRLWMSALWGNPTTYMELVFQKGQRVTLVYADRIALYDLSQYRGLANALRETAGLLRNDDVMKLAELVASRLQMYLTVFDLVGGGRRGRAEYLADMLRVLRGVLSSDSSSGAERAFAAAMLRGIS
ncbi:MAG: hypothetical protein ABWJ97_05550, partial [Thermoproteus sp.]